MNSLTSRTASALLSLAVVAWLAGCEPKPSDPPKPSTTRSDTTAPAATPEPRPVDLRLLT